LAEILQFLPEHLTNSGRKAGTMKTSNRLFWMIALLFFLGGCSSYRVVGTSLEEVAPPPLPETGTKDGLRENDIVRLTLVDGEMVEGRVMLISAEEIVLNPQEESAQPRGYFASQIESIEMKSGGGGSAEVAVAVTAGVLIVGGVILYSETASLRDGMFSK
jgi:hypothetical protein